MAATPARPAVSSPSAHVERWAWFGLGLGVATLAFLAYQLFAAPSSAVRVSAPPRPTPAPLLVHVVGEVAVPGVYTLATGARVEDAIRLAGGATSDADTAAINLAARAADGQRIVVPRRGGTVAAAASAPGASTAPADTTQSAPAPAVAPAATRRPTGGKVDLNTASFAELDTLPGVGRVTAERIMEHRQRERFTSVEQLLDLKIVNASTFQRIRDLVAVD